MPFLNYVPLLGSTVGEAHSYGRQNQNTMDHSENISTIVRPSFPGSNLGSTPNFALSRDNYPSLSKSSSNNKRQRAKSDDENQSFFQTRQLSEILSYKIKYRKSITSLSLFVIEKQIEAVIGSAKSVKKK